MMNESGGVTKKQILSLQRISSADDVGDRQEHPNRGLQGAD